MLKISLNFIKTIYLFVHISNTKSLFLFLRKYNMNRIIKENKTNLHEDKGLQHFGNYKICFNLAKNIL